MRRPSPYDREAQALWRPLEVRCRSERHYAQEPRALRWEGVWQPVQRVLARWRTPQGPAFRLLGAGGDLFEVHYLEGEAQWMGRRL